MFLWLYVHIELVGLVEQEDTVMSSKIRECLGSRSASGVAPGVASGMESIMITGRPSILRVRC